jgi:uncharacterized coiled-coil protein SlyX
MNEDQKMITELRKRVAELEKSDIAQKAKMAEKSKRIAELEFQNVKTQEALNLLKLQVRNVASACP